MADITSSADADTRIVTFSADTPKGEAFLEGPTLEVSLEEAPGVKARAEAKGLVVVAF